MNVHDRQSKLNAAVLFHLSSSDIDNLILNCGDVSRIINLIATREKAGANEKRNKVPVPVLTTSSN